MMAVQSSIAFHVFNDSQLNVMAVAFEDVCSLMRDLGVRLDADDEDLRSEVARTIIEIAGEDQYDLTTLSRLAVAKLMGYAA